MWWLSWRRDTCAPLESGPPPHADGHWRRIVTSSGSLQSLQRNRRRGIFDLPLAYGRGGFFLAGVTLWIHIGGVSGHGQGGLGLLQAPRYLSLPWKEVAVAAYADQVLGQYRGVGGGLVQGGSALLLALFSLLGWKPPPLGVELVEVVFDELATLFFHKLPLGNYNRAVMIARLPSFLIFILTRVSA